MRNVLGKSWGEKSHFVFNSTFFPPENYAIYGDNVKNMVEPHRP
jgi:hypothetical protein